MANLYLVTRRFLLLTAENMLLHFCFPLSERFSLKFGHAIQKKISEDRERGGGERERERERDRHSDRERTRTRKLYFTMTVV